MRRPIFDKHHSQGGRPGNWLAGLFLLMTMMALSGCSKLEWNNAPGMDASTEMLFLSQCKQMEIGGPGVCGCVVQEMLKTISLADFLAMGADQVPQTSAFLKQVEETRSQCKKEKGL